MSAIIRSFSCTFQKKYYDAPVLNQNTGCTCMCTWKKLVDLRSPVISVSLHHIHSQCLFPPAEVRKWKSVFAKLLFTMFLFRPSLAVLLQPSRRVISLRRDRTSLPGYNALRVTPAFLIYFFTDLIVTCTRAKGGSPGRLGLSPPIVSERLSSLLFVWCLVLCGLSTFWALFCTSLQVNSSTWQTLFWLCG